MLSTQVKKALGPIFPIANAVRLQLLKVKLAGNEVTCACCNKRFKHFATFGNDKRKNAWCPNCESLERHRLLWMYFKNKTNLYSQPIKLLHVAPETIFLKLFKTQTNLKYHPVDIFPELYPKPTTYLNILDHDIPDNCFDVIICNHVFQYIEDDKKAMTSIYNLLKPGGWSILQVPINTKRRLTYEDASITDPLEREKAFGLKEHVRYYSYDYADKLREAGFTVLVDDYSKEFTDEEIYKYGFFKGDAIYYCTKE